MDAKFVEYTLGHFLFFNVTIPAVFVFIAYMVGLTKGRKE